jgi:hypothetical protein
MVAVLLAFGNVVFHHFEPRAARTLVASPTKGSRRSRRDRRPFALLWPHWRNHWSWNCHAAGHLHPRDLATAAWCQRLDGRAAGEVSRAPRLASAGSLTDTAWLHAELRPTIRVRRAVLGSSLSTGAIHSTKTAGLDTLPMPAHEHLLKRSSVVLRLGEYTSWFGSHFGTDPHRCTSVTLSRK